MKHAYTVQSRAVETRPGQAELCITFSSLLLRQRRPFQMENHQKPLLTVLYVHHDGCLNLGSYAGHLLDHVVLQFHGLSEGLLTAS